MRSTTDLSHATAIHGLIFHQSLSLIPPSLGDNPLEKALTRWEAAAKFNFGSNKRTTSSNASWKRDGFTQHYEEFASLARVHLDMSHSPHKRKNSLRSERRGRIATFDQAGMGQVGDLIQAVEKMNLDSMK